MQTKVMRAWLKCELSKGRSKLETVVTVTGADGKKAEHSVPIDRIHPTGKAVLVMIFHDSQGFWVRFPTSSPYKPFRVTKDQLRKA